MLPEVGFSEMLIIGVVALLVVGPKDLPMLFRKLGEWTRKIREMATDFRHSFDEIARQSELEELRKEVEALKSLNPIDDIKREIQTAADMGDNLYRTDETQYEFVSEEATDAPQIAAMEKIKKPRKPRAKKVKLEDVE